LQQRRSRAATLPPRAHLSGGGKTKQSETAGASVGRNHFFVPGNGRNLFHASIFARLKGCAKSGLHGLPKTSPESPLDLSARSSFTVHR
jgi:hypothetical protein